MLKSKLKELSISLPGVLLNPEDSGLVMVDRLVDKTIITTDGVSPPLEALQKIEMNERLDDRYNLPSELIRQGMTLHNLKDEPLTQWFVLARMAFLRSINIAGSSIEDFDNLQSCRRIRVHVLTSPGFKHTGLISAFLRNVSNNIFVGQPECSVSTFGVVSSSAGVPLSMDCSFISNQS